MARGIAVPPTPTQGTPSSGEGRCRGAVTAMFDYVLRRCAKGAYSIWHGTRHGSRPNLLDGYLLPTFPCKRFWVFDERWRFTKRYEGKRTENKVTNVPIQVYLVCVYRLATKAMVEMTHGGRLANVEDDGLEGLRLRGRRYFYCISPLPVRPARAKDIVADKPAEEQSKRKSIRRAKRACAARGMSDVCVLFSMC